MPKRPPVQPYFVDSTGQVLARSKPVRLVPTEFFDSRINDWRTELRPVPGTKGGYTYGYPSSAIGGVSKGPLAKTPKKSPKKRSPQAPAVAATPAPVSGRSSGIGGVKPRIGPPDPRGPQSSYDYLPPEEQARRRKAEAKKKPKGKPGRSPQQTTLAVPTTEDQVQQIVAALLGPERLRLEQEEQNRQQAIQGFTKELIQMLGGQPGLIEQDYNNAIAQQTQLAEASRAGLQAASPDAQIQADLAAINAPELQRALIGEQNQNVFGGGGAVLFETGGRIPGANLVANKAAELAFSRTLPTVTGLRGQQDLASMLADIAQRRAQVEAQAPGLALQTQAQLSDAQAKEEALNINRAIAEAELGLKIADTRSKIQSRAASVQKSLVQQRNWMVKTFGFDPESGLTTVEYQRYLLAEKKAKQSSKKGGFTAKQRRDMQAQAFETATADFNGGYTDASGTFVETGKVRPIDTLRDLIASGIPFDIAIKALNRFWPHTKTWRKK